MNILLRDIDPTVIKKIDEMAKKQKISRQEFLKNVIENFAVNEKFKELEGGYLELIDKLAFIISDNTRVMKDLKSLVDD